MIKAIIQLGTSQHIVSVDDVLSVSIAQTDKNKFTVPVLAIIDGDKVSIGAPNVKDIEVEFTVEDQNERADKVTAIRYKAKKRVLKVRGHKQHLTRLKVSKIS
ncbi:MAG: 50S ribosomal protein L21 [bacterium]|nr:50S ribosomal protein L21 [bacterium]